MEVDGRGGRDKVNNIIDQWGEVGGEGGQCPHAYLPVINACL